MLIIEGFLVPPSVSCLKQGPRPGEALRGVGVAETSQKAAEHFLICQSRQTMKQWWELKGHPIPSQSLLGADAQTLGSKHHLYVDGASDPPLPEAPGSSRSYF